MFGEFQKLQKICNKMSTRIFKIDGEMPEIIEPKVGNPQNSTNQNLANLSQPWNLTFLEDEIFQLFFQSYVPKVPEWKIAHIEWSKKAQNIRKCQEHTAIRPFENTRYSCYFIKDIRRGFFVIFFYVNVK